MLLEARSLILTVFIPVVRVRSVAAAVVVTSSIVEQDFLSFVRVVYCLTNSYQD
jgi:hypothetical protein